MEIKSNYTVRVTCSSPKLTPKGKIAKKQYDQQRLPEFFQSIFSITACGFGADPEKGKETKITTARLNAITCKHRIVESIDLATQSVKYLLTDQLTWEAHKIISVYSFRWIIEEFFRNAKQLCDMEGATIRSKQGVTLALCLMTWIDFLLHQENYKRRTAEELSQESLTIPSIVRQFQYENLEAFAEKLEDETFVQKWLDVEKERIKRNRKERHQLIPINKTDKLES